MDLPAASTVPRNAPLCSAPHPLTQEDRRWLAGPGLELGVELHREEERMAVDLEDLHAFARLVSTHELETCSLQVRHEGRVHLRAEGRAGQQKARSRAAEGSSGKGKEG